VVVEEGLTLIEKVLFPFPLAVAPSLNVTVQLPEAVTFPVMVVLFPLQIVVLALVIEAVGRVLTVTWVDPVRSAAVELQ
jgi:hypothetical protein